MKEEGEVVLDIPAKVGGRPPGGESTIGEGIGLDGGPIVMCVGSFSCGVMYVGLGGVGGCLLGQGVCFSVAQDPRVGSNFVEVGGGPMADSVTEGHLQGLEEGQVFRL